MLKEIGRRGEDRRRASRVQTFERGGGEVGMIDLPGPVLNGPPPPSNLLLYFERQREAGRRRGARW